MDEKQRSRILAVLRQPGANKVLLAHQAGVHPNSLKRIEQANWNPQRSTLAAIMAAVERLEG